MWNDEDNNPYGSFDRHDSTASDQLHSAAADNREYSLLEVPSIESEVNLVILQSIIALSLQVQIIHPLPMSRRSS